MLTGTAFQTMVTGYWAKRFELTPQDFKHPGLHIIAEKEFKTNGDQYIYHIDQIRVVRCAPELAEVLRKVSGERDSVRDFTIDNLRSFMPSSTLIDLQEHFYFCYLDPVDFTPAQVPAGFRQRRLYGETDNATLLAFYSQCSEQDLDDAEIYLDEPDPVIFGLFDGEKMAAYASHRYWENARGEAVIADIGVLTHPDYRGRGLGKALVSELCKWCIENQVLPMYRVSQENPPSFAIQRTLGFQETVLIEVCRTQPSE